jgi:uncharacterized membrane protein
VKTILNSLKKSFLTGLILVLPLVVTLWILYLGFELIVGFSSPLVKFVFTRFGLIPFPGVAEAISLVITVVLLILLGLVGRSYLGKKAWNVFENLLVRLPLAKSVYTATRKLLDAFQRQNSFQRAALVEFPRKGCWVMGFITSANLGALNERTGKKYYNVFIPTTPNPTSGYLVLVPEEDLMPLDIPVDQAFTFIMSAGAVDVDLRFKKDGAAKTGSES